MERYVLKDNQRLRCGYTTGSCAAAAAQRAVAMVLGAAFSPGDKIVLSTPKGVRLELDALEAESGDGWASCAVKKDAGDDPDATNGILVYARVTKVGHEEEAPQDGVTVLRKGCPGITLDGGTGVGRVTKRGLSCPVGEAAINPVPRQMILEQVGEVCEEFDYKGGLHVEISVPGGEEIARRTFNPQLGVLGGISILGTSGIVEPMSDQALIDTIKVKMDVRKAEGAEYLVITPGNYGETFLKSHIPFPDTDSVKCSNFIGEALDYAEYSKFRGVLLVGHIGKFVKVAAGIMNTHSRYGDARMEIIGAHAALAGASKEVVGELLDCVTTEDAVSVLDQAGIKEQTLQSVLSKLDYHIKERVHHSMEIGAVIFSNQHGYLGETADAPLLREKLLEGACKAQSV
ncbi:MAG TPA: cobalt-precorrin-5B (C(1))-methyltransferase CbiD [Anaerovoracaceae bacterium]|nr:cobalt-precorrin-5B (C(1))-methyltransferase CbiD [Anaerovoracaceae bacterium]